MASGIKTAVITTALFIPLLCATLVLAAPPATGDKAGVSTARYTFAVVPFYTPEKIWALYSPFIEYLNRSTGQQWELKLLSNHDEIINGICSGSISAALLGPVPLGRANGKCGVKPLTVAIGSDGTPSFHSVILTNASSVATLKDLKGKKIGFFKGSTAAHIMPAKMLKDAGLGMASIQPLFLESQDRIMAALLSGELAAAGVKEALAHKFDKAGLKVLATSPPLPNFAVCPTPSLPAAVQKSLFSALANLKPLSNRKDQEAMKNWDDEIKNGFMAPDAEFLPSVIRLLGIFKEIQNVN